MAPEEADKAHQWGGMDGSTAWHLIDRHAENWNEVGELMNAWLRANVLAEREACAKVKAASEALREAAKVRCTCSGFVLQYEGGCCCESGKGKRAAEDRLKQAIDAL